MSDNQKAASILRQYAGELYQGHTIGGRWDDSSAHIKAEHDELLALADRLALGSAQERGEAVAPVMWQYRVYHTDPDDSGWGLWHDCHDASTATRLQSSEGYQVRHLYAAPTDAQSRIAELEAQLAAMTERYEANTAIMYARTEAMNRAHEQLTESREREGRMREAILNAPTLRLMQPHKDESGLNVIDGPVGFTYPGTVELIARPALAAEKEQK